MSRNYKAARLARKWKMTETAVKLGVSQPTLSAWENERKAPGIESLEKMADLYGVTTDYLLGRTPVETPSATAPIPPESLPIFHGRPLWSARYGWMLANAAERKFTLPDGSSVPSEGIGEVFAMPPAFTNTEPPHGKPLNLDVVINSDRVWVEPISPDGTLREELRGRYWVHSSWVMNECGVKFFFDSYGAKWLAFRTSIAGSEAT